MCDGLSYSNIMSLDLTFIFSTIYFSDLYSGNVHFVNTPVYLFSF